MHDILKIVLFASSAFLSLYVIARLLGKKQIAQLNFVDYVIGISLGSIAAEMAFDVSGYPFYYYMISMAIFLILDVFFSVIGKKGPFMKRLLNGKPTVIIYEGKLNYNALKKSGMDVNDLLAMMREQGYFDMRQIYYALLEPSGKLSVMPAGDQRPVVAGDLPARITPPQLPNYLVIDGVCSYSGLNELKKSKKWLLDELKLKDEKELKNIILALYDEKQQKIIAHYKDR